MAYNTETIFNLTFSIKKIYNVKSNGFTHCRIKLKKTTGYKGTLPKEIDLFSAFNNPFEGDIYSADVMFRESPDYGYSLKTVTFPSLVVPNTIKELSKFIHKRCSGIGKTLIDVAIEKIGLDIISKVAEDNSILDNIDAFTEKKKEKFIAFCETNTYFEELLLFIQTLKIPAKVATRIYDKFGKTSLHRIKLNPYYLYATNDISFTVADKLAFEYGALKWDDNKRLICAARAYVDDVCSSTGNVCVEYDDILRNLNLWLIRNSQFDSESQNDKGLTQDTGFDEEEIKRAIVTLLSRREFIDYVYESKTYIFKKNYFNTEKELSELILKRLKGTSRIYTPKREVMSYLDNSKNKLSSEQKSAVCEALRSRISILTGGPGTGKTFTVKMITKTIKHFNPKANILLLAPTGRAASKMREVSKMESNTIHSALKLLPDKTEDFNDEFIYDCDYVIMDEASMCDEWLFDMFFKRITNTASILIVGDSDQLPSVNVGNVLHDLIESKLIPTTELTQIFRQAGTSKIVTNAHAIKNSEYESIEIDEYNGFKNDFAMLESNSESEIADYTVEAFLKALESCRHIEDVIVLTPMKRGLIGVYDVNSAIQEKVNPSDGSTTEYSSGVKKIRIGDRVIQMKNNRDLGVSNGALGTVVNIEKLKKEISVYVQMDGIDDLVIYRGEALKDLELGYCITIHKSQGTEIPHVIMPIHNSQKNMLNKKLIYTAITRAKKTFLGIGMAETLMERVKVDNKDERISMLKDMLLSQK